ncbi:DnaJ domain-containing protein [Hymenobacter sp. BT770]|uniref:DnaJ domain-containing protein n=1 Tax=Hymenobacter sp. BT770 TaxID=2886942 RepID=UPI001D0FFDED|nr:DnaJ domain-containing protein [Hymenobacter sp. BT770]MCC3155397.1 DnaJ domain-containing protein [Hymenobacter sp. BT770]MDO3417426.1 DnaJ domain-containing protein [Hymenobacter sp. BT770]
MSQNHYQVLGVAPTAAAAEIKRAYRQLVVRYHPDKHGGDVRYEDQFKAVAVAYGILGDPGRRATYDFQLAQAARRAEDLRRQQQHRPATQHVYGVPMPPPAPLRTRPPAGSRERHYQRIPRQRARFTRRDWSLTVLLLLGITLFALAVKVTMDRVTANSNYEDGLRAYGRGQLAAAYSFLEETLHFRPNYAPALRRLAELELLVNHDPRAARADFQAALLEPQPRRDAADMLYRLGRCETELGLPRSAEFSYTRAISLDTALSAAYLARGKARLLDLNLPGLALADLSHGIAQRQRANAPTPWAYVQIRGLAYTALGRYDEARAEYFQVLQARPRDGRTHFLLGRLAAQTGNKRAACEFYRRALRLGYEYARTAEESCP